MYVLKVKLVSFTHSSLIVALAAIYWSISAGLKWDFGVFTALGADYGEHSSLGPVATISVTLCLPCLAACRTALGLIGIASSLEELLFLGAEGEGSPTIGTLKCLFLKAHG